MTLNFVFFCFKLPLAFKVGVLNYYGGEWLPRASQWTVLAAGAVLGHGAAEAAFRAATDWPERFQVALPATRAGMARQRQSLRGWLVFLLFIRCGGDCRVLAVLRPGVRLWNLAEALFLDLDFSCFFHYVCSSWSSVTGLVD